MHKVEQKYIKTDQLSKNWLKLAKNQSKIDHTGQKVLKLINFNTFWPVWSIFDWFLASFNQFLDSWSVLIYFCSTLCILLSSWYNFVLFLEVGKSSFYVLSSRDMFVLDAGTNVRQTNVRQSNVRQSNVRQTNVRHVKCSTSLMFDINKCSTLSNVRQSNVRHVLCSTSLMFDNQMFDKKVRLFNSNFIIIFIIFTIIFIINNNIIITIFRRF